jgi:hypothetical protein
MTLVGNGTSDLYLVDRGFDAEIQVIRFPPPEE